MGNNLVHINAENYLQDNLVNLSLIREEVFLNLYYEEKKIQTENDKKPNDNSKKNHEILKNFNIEQQIEYINNHKLSAKLKSYIKTALFYNFNIPEIQEVVNQKIKSKNLFDNTIENIKSLNNFGLKLFNIVKKYINTVLPEELKSISEEPLLYYFVNQLKKPLIKDYIIYTIYDFISLGDLSEEDICKLFNVKNDKYFKEQINEVKNLKKKYYNIVKKYYDMENKKNNKNLKLLIILISVIILLMAIFIFKNK